MSGNIEKSKDFFNIFLRPGPMYGMKKMSDKNLIFSKCLETSKKEKIFVNTFSLVPGLEKNVLWDLPHPLGDRPILWRMFPMSPVYFRSSEM